MNLVPLKVKIRLRANGHADHPDFNTLPMEIYSESSSESARGTFTDVTTPADTDKRFRPLYPGLHPLAGGEVFFAPVGFQATTNEPSAIFDFTSGPTTGEWHDIGANDRTKGMSVLLLSQLYPFTQVMIIGGGDSTKNNTYQIINLSAFSPAWLPAVDLEIDVEAGQTEPTPRINVNVVLLPDGTVLMCGGASVAEPCWLYNPANNAWSKMDNLNYYRAYHSLAILLPTAEVAVTGGSNNIIEIFKPPYLFKGAQPDIDSAATDDLVHHGRTFTITTPQASDIRKVVLVRPMAVTHQTDSEQRVIQLCFTQLGANTLSATAPNGWHPHALAPRGWYMLFILNGDGVPSTAHFIHLH